MFRIFISQPMAGKSTEQLLKEREEIKHQVIERAVFDYGVREDEIAIIDSVIKTYLPDIHPLFYLGNSIMMMAIADAVYFCNGWGNARGCRIEHRCAKEYDKRIMYETTPYLDTHKENNL